MPQIWFDLLDQSVTYVPQSFSSIIGSVLSPSSVSTDQRDFIGIIESIQSVSKVQLLELLVITLGIIYIIYVRQYILQM